MTYGLHFLRIFVILGVLYSLVFVYSNNVAAALTEPATSSDAIVPDTRLPEQLFDIRLSLEKSEVSSVRDLSSRVEFTSFGRVPTPVQFHFTITDAAGRQAYSSNIETVVVETELQYPKRFLDAQQLPAGLYVLHVETTYKGTITDTFSQNFTISETSENGVLYIILSILGAGTIIWVGYLIAHIRHKIPQDRMIAITTRTAAVVFAGVILPTAAQLVDLQMTADNHAQASLSDGITLRAGADVAAFITYAERVRSDFATLSVHAPQSQGDDHVIQDAAETLTIDAVHILNPDGSVRESAFRELGFTRGAPRAAPLVAEGLYRRADGEWRTVATYPRTEGGWYRLEASLTDQMSDIARSMRPKEETFLIDETGAVLVGSEHHPVGNNLFEAFPDMATSIQSHEYYEGVSSAEHFFTSRRVFVPKGQGVQWLYLVSEGYYEYRTGAAAYLAF